MILERLASRESRNLRRRDLDFFIRARVTARACSAAAQLEGAEADEGDVFTLLEGVLHCFDQALERLASVGLRQFSLLSNGGNQVGFIHYVTPFQR